ncbi:5'/3'-nucleotidase SurE, partial [Aeromonas hydrophila]|uniref:5'/3'-nucleotidase SurE n=2 Tax=Pseudomonadota TaxID=1224 RepID=UPI00214E09E8
TIGFDPEGRQHWKSPLEHGPRLVEQLLSVDWPESTLMNINYPDLAPGDVKGVAATRQGRRDQGGLHIQERSDTWGDPYFWVGFERRRADP